VNLDRLIPAGTRTIFDFTVDTAPGIERLATMGTSERAAGITNCSTWRPGPKLFAALLASLTLSDNGQASITHQVRMCPIKSLFGYAVAHIAEGDQIVQAIGLLVGLEQMERLFVVYREIVNRSAMLAGVPISLNGFFSLFVPVCAAIVDMPTLPNRAICAHKAPFAPFRVTGPIAKVALFDLARLQLKRLSTLGTLNRDTLSACALSVLSLPKAIAVFVTEVVFCQGFSVPFGLELLPALVTR